MYSGSPAVVFLHSKVQESILEDLADSLDIPPAGNLPVDNLPVDNLMEKYKYYDLNREKYICFLLPLSIFQFHRVSRN